jgi:tetratricopeptide (TPR) repeat protein
MLVLALNAFGKTEKWLDAYNRGVAAVNGRNYKAGADALQQAINERPNEGTSIRTGNQIIAVYTPHFFLGIAKFNLGDVDGALREWRISEEQGVITRTEYYSNLKDWVARGQTEKQRNAVSAASVSKKEADNAISRALALQVDALSAGGDRTDSYRAAQRKLQEAMGQFQKAGTNIDAYKTAGNTAEQATTLFTKAAEEGKKLRAAQAARPPAPKPQTVQPQPVQQKPAPVVVKEEPPPVPVKSEAQVSAELAVQQFGRDVAEAQRASSADVQSLAKREASELDALRKLLGSSTTEAQFQRVARTAGARAQAMKDEIVKLNAPKPAPAPVVAAQIPIPAPVAAPQPRNVDGDLRLAYRAYASGDLDSAEETLTRVVNQTSNAQAYLLRGCARYTRAMLSRAPEGLLAQAKADFKAALGQNRALRLDPSAFSPKLVAYFEQVRTGR